MSTKQLQHVTIIGVGLLGGSIALALRKRFPDIEIAGVGRRLSSLRAAKRVGAIDSSHLDTYEVVAKSDLVFLATPVCAFENILRQIKPHLKPDAIVTDAGSTKAEVVRIAEKVLGRGGPFVGSHPMAGSEQKGPAFARADLLADALCVITPTANTPPSLVRKVEKIWKLLGMRTKKMSPADHDQAVASVSHLPHMLASMLVEIPRDEDFAIASTGLRDMTRLAAGDPEMWRDIIATNPKPLLTTLAKMRKQIDRLEKLIKQGNPKTIQKMLDQAKARRDKFLG